MSENKTENINTLASELIMNLLKIDDLSRKYNLGSKDIIHKEVMAMTKGVDLLRNEFLMRFDSLVYSRKGESK